jgi:hypothetical protein
MAGPIISKLLTDFFNEIGHKQTHRFTAYMPLLPWSLKPIEAARSTFCV